MKTISTELTDINTDHISLVRPRTLEGGEG